MKLMIRLNAEWTQLMKNYDADHQNPTNQACHKVGIPLIAGSLPVGITIIGLPLAISMFSVGWTFQFVGHVFEGKQPSFVGDRRYLIVGLLWWLKKNGAAIEMSEDAIEEAPSSGVRADISAKAA